MRYILFATGACFFAFPALAQNVDPVAVMQSLQQQIAESAVQRATHEAQLVKQIHDLQAQVAKEKETCSRPAAAKK